MKQAVVISALMLAAAQAYAQTQAQEEKDSRHVVHEDAAQQDHRLLPGAFGVKVAFQIFELVIELILR